MESFPVNRPMTKEKLDYLKEVVIRSFLFELQATPNTEDRVSIVNTIKDWMLGYPIHVWTRPLQVQTVIERTLYTTPTTTFIPSLTARFHCELTPGDLSFEDICTHLSSSFKSALCYTDQTVMDQGYAMKVCNADQTHPIFGPSFYINNPFYTMIVLLVLYLGFDVIDPLTSSRGK